MNASRDIYKCKLLQVSYNSLEDEVDDADLRTTIKIISEQIEAVLTLEEAMQITLAFEADGGSVSVGVSGLDESIVEKAAAAIGDE